MQRFSHTMQRLSWVAGVMVVACGLVGLLFMTPGRVSAQAGGGETAVVPDAPALPATAPGLLEFMQTEPADSHVASPDLACAMCHGDTTAEIEFPSGETLPVIVDLAALEQSVHGMAGADLACTDCHQSVNDYTVPHAPVEAPTLRDYEVGRANVCERCHQQPHLTSHPGPEAAMPVTCTDCHGSHNVHSVEAWEAGDETDTCVNCHVAAGVAFAEPDRLTPLIRSGLFADEADNDYCLSCHRQPGLVLTFPNGDTTSATVDADAFHSSVHGVDNPWQPLNCTDCHENYQFPHQPITANSYREYHLEQYLLCVECHEQYYEETLDSTHARALAEGNEDAAVCTDCHGAHDTPEPDVPRQRISLTCGQCHGTVFEEYVDSVHGAALFAESNPDVPTCIECHGVHNIADPTTALFRVRSPELCASCHADEELMAQYEISTEVFDTYVADFHGTTVTLFEHQDPEVETNKAVCYDCHGVHDIKDPADPEAGIKANLLETCQQCHPDATANFPDSWTSHFPPSLDNNPGVYLVNLFYQIIIPATVIFLSFLVLTDIYRKIRLRFRPSPRVAENKGSGD